MRRDTRILVLAAVLSATFVGWWACRHPQRPHPLPPQGEADRARPAGASGPGDGAQSAEPAPPPAPRGSVKPDATAPEDSAAPPPTLSPGDARLRERLRLENPRASPTAEQLKQWTPGELALFAEVERRTGRPAPDGVREVVLRRRDGVSYDGARALANERIADALARGVVLEWLRREYEVPQRAPEEAARPDATPPVRPLEPVPAPAPGTRR